MRWKDVKITGKFGIAFAVVVIIILSVAASSIRGTSRIMSNFNEIVYGNKIKATLMQRHVDHLQWSLDLSKLLTDENTNQLTIETNPHKCGFGKWYYGDERKEAEKMIPELIPVLKDIEASHIRLHQSAIAVGDAYKESLEKAIVIYENETLASLKIIGGQLRELEALTEAHLEKNEAVANETRDSSRLSVIIFSVVAALAATLLSIILSKGIINPLKKGTEFAQKLAEGDLTADIDLDQKDEIGLLTKALKNVVKKLQDVVGNVKTASYQIASASAQLSNSSQLMSEGASDQASSAEEVSASMEEMTSSIEQNTDNAKHTQEAALLATEKIQQSNESVKRTVHSMETIADKISIIGEIAQQTNLLALNAAVEAARAGEHGKGFAVVAGEIRKLAERSHLAASEIDEVSKTSVSTAQQSGLLLDEAVPIIQKNGNLMKEIAAASIEQSTGAEQVNSAIQSLNHVVQQNAAVSEEMAASSQELSAQAEMLKESVSFFKVDKADFKKKVSSSATPKKVGDKLDKSFNGISDTKVKREKAEYYEEGYAKF